MAYISEDQVRDAKQRIYNGQHMDEIRRATGIAISTLYKLRNGAIFADIAWPDGSLGPLSPTRIGELVGARAQAKAETKSAIELKIEEINKAKRKFAVADALDNLPKWHSSETLEKQRQRMAICETEIDFRILWNMIQTGDPLTKDVCNKAFEMGLQSYSSEQVDEGAPLLKVSLRPVRALKPVLPSQLGYIDTVSDLEEEAAEERLRQEAPTGPGLTLEEALEADRSARARNRLEFEKGRLTDEIKRIQNRPLPAAIEDQSDEEDV